MLYQCKKGFYFLSVKCLNLFYYSWIHLDQFLETLVRRCSTKKAFLKFCKVRSKRDSCLGVFLFKNTFVWNISWWILLNSSSLSFFPLPQKPSIQYIRYWYIRFFTKNVRLIKPCCHLLCKQLFSSEWLDVLIFIVRKIFIFLFLGIIQERITISWKNQGMLLCSSNFILPCTKCLITDFMLCNHW